MTTVFDSKDIVYFYDDQGIFGWANTEDKGLQVPDKTSSEESLVNGPPSIDKTEDVKSPKGSTSDESLKFTSIVDGWQVASDRIAKDCAIN